MVAPKKRPGAASATKNPPTLSQEFFIQNHADIFCFIAIIILVAMMAQTTSRFATPFVALAHNVTTVEELQQDPTRLIEYAYGLKDLCTVGFYVMVCIIVHQVIQEYVIDKLTRRLHLSKLRTSRFGESGQLVCFYLISAIWAADIVIVKNYWRNYNSVWENYPHNRMGFNEKFFFILQMAHWFHTYAELYLQKVKFEEVHSRIIYMTLNLVAVLFAYMTSFHRLGLILLMLHSATEFVLHTAKLLHYADKNRLAQPLFSAFNAMFIFERVFNILFSAYVMLVALKPSQKSSINWAEGDFNTPFARMVCFGLIVLINVYMTSRFLSFHMKRRRERTQTITQRKVRKVTERTDRHKKTDEEVTSGEEEEPTTRPMKNESISPKSTSPTAASAKPLTTNNVHSKSASTNNASPPKTAASNNAASTKNASNNNATSPKTAAANNNASTKMAANSQNSSNATSKTASKENASNNKATKSPQTNANTNANKGAKATKVK